MKNEYPIREIPCNGCTLCCQGDAVRLDKEDVSRGYQTEPHPFVQGALMLAHKPNGECVYLNKDGCSIHDHAPSLCRIADCRSLALRLSYAEARALHNMNRLDMMVWNQGHLLLEQMTGQKKRSDL
jgi:hypothetical protein